MGEKVREKERQLGVPERVANGKGRTVGRIGKPSLAD